MSQRDNSSVYFRACFIDKMRILRCKDMNFEENLMKFFPFFSANLQFYNADNDLKLIA